MSGAADGTGIALGRARRKGALRLHLTTVGAVLSSHGRLGTSRDGPFEGCL